MQEGNKNISDLKSPNSSFWETGNTVSVPQSRSPPPPAKNAHQVEKMCIALGMVLTSADREEVSQGMCQKDRIWSMPLE